MIITLLINLVILIFGSIFVFLPVVTIADIPIMGEFISESLTFMVQVWNSFLETVPYLTFTWSIFLYILLPFEILLLIGKFFLGHRMPHTDK